MTDSDAGRLLGRSLGAGVDIVDTLQIATELEHMPLALTQAAAYLRHMRGRCSVRKCLERLRNGDKSKKSIVDEDASDLRRDREARNSVFLTWQISFEHTYKTRQSAAELLSLISFCDRQAIPKALMRQRRSNEDAGDRERDRDSNNNEPDDSSSDPAKIDEALSADDAGDSLDNGFDEDIRMLEGY